MDQKQVFLYWQKLNGNQSLEEDVPLPEADEAPLRFELFQEFWFEDYAGLRPTCWCDT